MLVFIVITTIIIIIIITLFSEYVSFFNKRIECEKLTYLYAYYYKYINIDIFVVSRVSIIITYSTISNK